MNYFEIYKESLNNLISRNQAFSENLKIGNSRVLNADPVSVTTIEEIFHFIKIGQEKV